MEKSLSIRQQIDLMNLVCNFFNKFTINKGKFDINNIKGIDELIELIKDSSEITHEEIQKKYNKLKYNNIVLNRAINKLRNRNNHFETNLKKIKCEYNNIINKKRKFIDINKEEEDEDLCFICCDYDVSKKLNCCGKKICGICVCDISRKNNLCPYCRKQNMEDNIVELDNIIKVNNKLI